MRDYLGHAIVDGQLLYTSVSSVKLFDPRTKGGCPQRWHRKYIGGMREVESLVSKEAKDKGLALDKELKRYLATGDKALSSLALRGLHILEAPGPDLGLDVAVHTAHYFDPTGVAQPPPPVGEDGQIKLPKGWSVKVSSILTAAGIPFVGELDVVHDRGHWRDDDGEYHDDPPGTVEVGDIKFKSNARDRDGNSNLFLPSDLIRDVQMAGYGEWVHRFRPNATHARLSLLYFPEKEKSKVGTPTKVTRLHVIDDCSKTWGRVEGVVREMIDVARETNVDLVPGAADLSVCDAYAGCPHREYCNAYKKNSLDKTYGATTGKLAQDYAANKPAGWNVYGAPQGDTPMGILGSNPQMMQNAQQAPMQQQAPQQDVRAQLLAEEQQQRQQVAQTQQQMMRSRTTDEFVSVRQKLGNYGFGYPALGGNAAAMFAQIGGQAYTPGNVYQGVPAAAGAKRSLHSIRLDEVENMFQLEAELAKEAGVPAFGEPGWSTLSPAEQMAKQQAPVTQNTPWGTVQVAQGPLPQNAQAVQVQQSAPGAQAGGILPPDAPQSMPQLAQVQTQAPPQQAPVEQQGPINTTQPGYNATAQIPPNVQTAAPEAPKPSRGRPKKSQDAAPVQTAASVQGSPIASAPAPASQVAPAATSASTPSPIGGPLVLVNCRTDAFETESLAGYVDYINGEIAKKYNIGKDGRPGLLDCRVAVDGSVLGYGGWKGAVREIVPTDLPPPSVYHLDTRRDDMCEAVVDGLRKAGWTIIRGVFS